MSWWDIVYKSLNKGDRLFTPGRGLDGGSKKRPFTIFSKYSSKIVIHSGDYNIPLVKKCFDVVEEALVKEKYRCLRVASLRAHERLDDSADKLIRIATKSNLARGNYVCAMLERCKLVKYTMQGNRKVIELPCSC